MRWTPLKIKTHDDDDDDDDNSVDKNVMHKLKVYPTTE